MSDTLVILTALSGMRLAKSFSWNNITQKPAETKPEMPKHFAVHEREVDSFEGMVEILEGVQTHPNQAVIRGAPKATTNQQQNRPKVTRQGCHLRGMPSPVSHGGY